MAAPSRPLRIEYLGGPWDGEILDHAFAEDPEDTTFDVIHSTTGARTHYRFETYLAATNVEDWEEGDPEALFVWSLLNAYW